ncbi:MAG: transposase [Burkholderiales bacterium]|nr:transposase [Burkholderiales bacterium]
MTKRAVEMRARSSGWPYEEQVVRGGRKRLYAYTDLPRDVSDAVREHRARQAAANIQCVGEGRALRVKSEISAIAQFESRERTAAQLVGLPDRAKTRMEARAAVLRMFAAYHAARAGSVASARVAFARAWQRAELNVPADIRATIRQVSAASLARWQKQAEKHGGRALAGRYGNRKGSGIIDSQPQLADAILGLIRVMPHIKPDRVLQALSAQFRDHLIEQADAATGEIVRVPAELPSLRSLQRWMQQFRQREHAALMRNANPDKYRSTYRPAFGNASAGIERLNQIWEMDSTPVDVMTTDGRCTVIGTIDVYSRRLKLLVSRTSRAVAVGLALRRAMLAWGVPEAVRTDNGSDYVSRHVTLGLSALGIQHMICDPFSPDQKPFIERALGTFLHDIVEVLPGYIGHNVAERKAIESRKSFAARQAGAEPISVQLSARRLQEICDQWCEHVYAHRAHDGLRGATPTAVTAAWVSPIRRIENERAVDVLLAEAGGSRRITNKGLRIDGLTYIAPELGPCVGEKVFAFHDPDGDLGRVVVWRQVGTEAEFLCIAECPEVTGVSRAAVSAQAKALAKMEVNATLAKMKEHSRRYRSADVARLILDDAIARGENVVAMPAASVPYTTPAIEEASIAAEQLAPRELPLITEVPEGAQARVIELEANHNALQRAREEEEREKDARFRRWLGIKDLPRDQLDADTREWVEFYTETAEFHARLTLYEGFGPTGVRSA